MKSALVTALAALSVGASAGAAPADTAPSGGGAVNLVISRASLDGSLVARAQTRVTQTGGMTVAPSNVADAATSTCTGCHSTAVAVQAVVFSGSPRSYRPGNAAVATNSACTGCGAYAYAYQYLVQVDRPFAFSTSAERRIHEIRDSVDEVASSIVPNSLDHDRLLDFELNGLTSELRAAIDDAVADASARFTADPIERTDREER